MSEAILEPDLPICDPHHHLWDFSSSRGIGLLSRPSAPAAKDATFAAGRNDDNCYLLPQLLADVGSGHRVESTVFVEATAFYRAGVPTRMSYIGETEFANGVAAMTASGRYGNVRACEGIVGRADLSEGATVREVLEAHVAAGNGRFRGIRHVGAWDASPDVRRSHTHPPQGLYATAKFREGFAQLEPLDLSFEAWQYHPQLSEVAALADAFPSTRIVLNHVGGPLGVGPYAGKRKEVFKAWAAGVQELAKRSNTYVKLGGLGMPICGFDFPTRTTPPSSEELAAAWQPYLDTCIEAFGPARGMFESNFPVDRVSCSYATLWNAFKRAAQGASATEKLCLFRDTARSFYRLP